MMKTTSDLLKRADEMRREAAKTHDRGAKTELLKLSAMWERLARAIPAQPRA